MAPEKRFPGNREDVRSRGLRHFSFFVNLCFLHEVNFIKYDCMTYF